MTDTTTDTTLDLDETPEVIADPAPAPVTLTEDTVNIITDTVEAQQPGSPVEPDWALLDHEWVASAIEAASGRIAAIHSGLTTAGDQAQEAAIHVATNAEDVHALLADELFGERALHQWVFNRLRNGMRTDVARAELEVPFADGLHAASGTE